MYPGTEKIVRDIATKEGVENYKITCSSISNKGDGYLGTIQGIQLVGSNKTVDIVMKWSGGDHGAFPTHDIYLNEIIYYEKVLPAYAHLNEEHNIADPFENHIKFYGAIKEKNEECIILENIKVLNYEMWNGKQPMDEVHFELVLKTLAKLHGTSFAFKTMKSESYHDLAQQLLPEEALDSILEKMQVKKQLQYLVKEVVHTFNEHTEYEYWKAINEFAMQTGDLYEQLMKLKTDIGTILLHGDFWCNNVMFQYDDDCQDRSRPQNLKFFDFQLAKAGKAVMDLSAFIFSSASQQMLDDEVHYLNMYYDALAKHLQQFNLNVEKIYPNEDFLDDWKMFSKFGLIMAILFRKVMLINTEDAGEFDNTEYVNSMVLSESNCKRYNQEMRALVKHCVDRKYI